jgi:hypothetical protein
MLFSGMRNIEWYQHIFSDRKEIQLARMENVPILKKKK